MRGSAVILVTLLTLPLPATSQTATLPAHPDDKSGFEDRPPEGLFISIVMAHGQELVMGKYRSYEIVPVKPSKTFSADVPEIFVVFQVHPHYSPYQVFGRWIVEKGEGVPDDFLLGTDTMYLALEDDSGYVSLKRPSTGWPVGDYKVEIHVGMKITDISQVGTLRFKILPPKMAS